MAGYTRQSSFADGDIIQAADFNDEYNQLLNVFSNTTGHAHDGTAAEGPVIGLIGDPGVAAPINKVVVDNTNNRVGLFIDAGSLGTSVEQLRFQDGVILPVTTNDIDIGSSSLKFKDGYFAGNVIANNIASTSYNSDIIPDTDDAYDLGSASAEWKDLYLDGTANVDALVIGTATAVTDIDTDLTTVSASNDTLASAKAIKTYVDSQVTAQDLDFQGDTGGALSIDLDSEALTIAGGTGIDTSGSLNTLTVAIDSTVATLTGTQTLTNKTLTTPIISSISNTGTLTLPTSTDTLVGLATTDTLTNKTLTSAVLNGTISGTSIKDEDNMVSDSASHLATQQSIKAYVDAQVTAQDLDFQADTGGALNIDLDSETLTLTGGTGIDTAGSGNAVTFNIDSTVATLTDTQTFTNKTLTSAVLNGTISGTSIKDEDTMVSDSASHLATQQSIKAYVDAQVAAVPVGDITEVTAGTGLTGGGTTGAVTLNIDSTVTTLTGTQTLTNKTLTSPTVNGGSLSTTVTGVTQPSGTSDTTIATTAFAVTAANNAAVAMAIALG
jgi:hypothetical protein